MQVFIPSVTDPLNDERAALSPFLRLFDDEPLRLEDFEAKDRSSREAQRPDAASAFRWGHDGAKPVGQLLRLSQLIVLGLV